MQATASIVARRRRDAVGLRDSLSLIIISILLAKWRAIPLTVPIAGGWLAWANLANVSASLAGRVPAAGA